MSEIRRVLRADGFAIILVPLVVGVDETHEDTSIESEATALEVFRNGRPRPPIRQTRFHRTVEEPPGCESNNLASSISAPRLPPRRDRRELGALRGPSALGGSGGAFNCTGVGRLSSSAKRRQAPLRHDAIARQALRQADVDSLAGPTDRTRDATGAGHRSQSARPCGGPRMEQPNAQDRNLPDPNRHNSCQSRRCVRGRCGRPPSCRSSRLPRQWSINFAHRSERHAQRRQQPIDAATQPLANEFGEMPRFSRHRSSEHRVGEFRAKEGCGCRQQTIPVPPSRRWRATKSAGARQSPSRKMQ